MVIMVTFENCHIVAKNIVREDRKLALGFALELIAQLGIQTNSGTEVSPAIVGSQVVEVQDLTHSQNQN